MSAAIPGMKITAEELARRVDGKWLTPPGEVTITAIEIDSRQCAQGTLFAALAGQHVDGHDYVAAATANGATAALVSRDPGEMACSLLMVDDVEAALTRLGAFGRAVHRMAGGHLVAITGSVGKTGSKEMLAHMLRQLGGCHANRASFNNHLGVPLTLAALPESPIAAIQEIGMNAPGEITKLSALAQPDIAVITRIANSHAGFFDSLDDIAAAKAEIFEGLTDGGIAILNADDPYFTFLGSRASTAGASRIIGFGTASGAEAQLLDIVPDNGGPAAGMTVRADILGTTLTFRMGMRGHHWAHNATAMLAAVATLGLDIKDAASSLNDFRDLPGRGAISSGVYNGKSMTLIDDSYNAGPASMAAAFTTLDDVPPQIMVLSDMLELGESGEAAHAALAAAIATLAPRIVITIGPMMAKMASQLPGSIEHHSADTPAAALQALQASLVDGDHVFIKGSNGSGAWRVAAAILEELADSTDANGGASHAA